MTSSYTEEVHLHILGKSRRRWVETRNPWMKRNKHTNLDHVSEDHGFYTELRVQVDAFANFELLAEKKDDDDDVMLGVFPVQIYELLSRSKLSQFMMRSNTSEDVSHLVPRGTEVYAVGAADETDIAKTLKRSIAGLTCTPLADMKNDYGKNKNEFHGMLLTSGGMCTEEIQAHMKLLPSNGEGLYNEALSTLLSTSVGSFKRTTNRSMGISAIASPSCFARRSSDDCAINLQLATSYIVLINMHDMTDYHNVSLSLDQIFLGSHRARKIDGAVSIFPYSTSNFQLFRDTFSKKSIIYTIIPEVRLFDCLDHRECGPHDNTPLIAGINFKQFTPSNMISNSSVARFEHDMTIYDEIDMTREFISFPIGMVENLAIGSEQYPTKNYIRYITSKQGVVSRGTFQSVTRNSSRKCNLIVSVEEIYPSFISLILRSAKVFLHQGGGAGKEEYSSPSIDTIVTELNIMDSKMTFNFREDESILVELTHTLPPDSSLWVSMEFEPQFLNFERFPADPNRGMDIPPAFVTFSESNCKENRLSKFQYYDKLKATSKLYPLATDQSILYSNPLLIMPPLPDSTMPFNVVCLSSTLFAFVIGLFLNILVKKTNETVRCRLYNEEPEKSKLKKLVSALVSRITALKSKFKKDNHINIKVKKE